MFFGPGARLDPWFLNLASLFGSPPWHWLGVSQPDPFKSSWLIWEASRGGTIPHQKALRFKSSVINPMMKDAETRLSQMIPTIIQRPQSAIRLSNCRRKQCFNQFLCKNPPNRSIFFAIKNSIKGSVLQSGLKKASCRPYFYSKSGSKSINSELRLMRRPVFQNADRAEQLQNH